MILLLVLFFIKHKLKFDIVHVSIHIPVNGMTNIA